MASSVVRKGLECHLILKEWVEGRYDNSTDRSNYAFELLGTKKKGYMAGRVANTKRELAVNLEGRARRCTPFGAADPMRWMPLDTPGVPLK